MNQQKSWLRRHIGTPQEIAVAVPLIILALAACAAMIYGFGWLLWGWLRVLAWAWNTTSAVLRGGARPLGPWHVLAVIIMSGCVLSTFAAILRLVVRTVREFRR